MTKPVKQPMCVRCRFYQQSNVFPNHGECRAGLPQPIGVWFCNEGHQGQWPIVMDADWCGEYMPRRTRNSSLPVERKP